MKFQVTENTVTGKGIRKPPPVHSAPLRALKLLQTGRFEMSRGHGRYQTRAFLQETDLWEPGLGICYEQAPDIASEHWKSRVIPHFTEVRSSRHISKGKPPPPLLSACLLLHNNILSWKKKKKYMYLGINMKYVQVIFSLTLMGKGQEVKEMRYDAGQKEGH